MPKRQKPPNRRLCETHKVKLPISFDDPGAGNKAIYVSIGFARDSSMPIEVFYAGGFRSSSSMEFMASDACVILSIALQNGIELDQLTKSLSRRELPDGSFVSVSLLSAIVGQILEDSNAS